VFIVCAFPARVLEFLLTTASHSIIQLFAADIFGLRHSAET